VCLARSTPRIAHMRCALTQLASAPTCALAHIRQLNGGVPPSRAFRCRHANRQEPNAGEGLHHMPGTGTAT
jgi:hypothetical protein